jgi:hypothetical protein
MNKSIFFVQKKFEKFVDILATVSFVATLSFLLMVQKASAMSYFSQIYTKSFKLDSFL